MTSTAKDLPREFRTPNARAGLDDAKWLCHLGQNVCRAQQLLSLMRRADDRAKPRFSFSNSGIDDRRGEYACFKKLLRLLKRPPRLSHVNADHQRTTHLEFKHPLLRLAF